MPADKPLTRDLLVAPESTNVLGTIAKARLWEDGFVCMHFNSDQQVEVVPLREVQLDGAPEQDAIRELMAKGYEQAALIAYLKAREARLRLASQG